MSLYISIRNRDRTSVLKISKLADSTVSQDTLRASTLYIFTVYSIKKKNKIRTSRIYLFLKEG